MNSQETDSKLYKELLNKINTFLNQDFSVITDSEIESYLLDILHINNISNPIVIVELTSNDYYYRIRNDYNYKEDYDKEKYFNINNVLGNPDAPLARMNLEHEQGLYLSNLFETAILECDIKENDQFTTTIFSPKKPLNVIVTSVTGKYYNEPNRSSKISKLLSKFIFECLTMPGDKSKDTYRITNSLLKILYKSFKVDGLLYYSSKKKSDFNLFINKSSIDKLQLNYIFTCTYKKSPIITECHKVINNKELSQEITKQDIESIINSV